MRSLDPMRNFPELGILPEPEARRLVVETQKRITREPAVLVGLIAAAVIPAMAIVVTMELTGPLVSLMAIAVVWLVTWFYRIIVIKPRMHAAFRDMGYRGPQG